MAFTKDLALIKAKEFVALIKKNGIDVSEAYLFGSIIKDEQQVDSDIDIAIVSKHFDGVTYYDIRKVSKYRREIDLRIELHPFSFREIAEEPPLFFYEIQNKGISLI